MHMIRVLKRTYLTCLKFIVFFAFLQLTGLIQHSFTWNSVFSSSGGRTLCASEATVVQ